MTSLYEIEVTGIDGRVHRMAEYRGRLLLVVNVASRCGYTSQYAGLEELHRRFADRGLSVLGFPCDQFGHQEPGTEAEIRQFCSLTYDVTFPMFGKVEVNGRNAHPLFRHLTRDLPGLFGTRRIKWNFTKFLLDRDGRGVKRYPPKVKPAQLVPDLDRLLGNDP